MSESRIKRINDLGNVLQARRVSKRASLENACRACLLWHSSVSGWTAKERDEWYRLTGNHLASVETLCEVMREALGEQEAKP